MSLNITLLYFDAKGPSDTLPHKIDFSLWLAGIDGSGADLIASATMTATPAGLTITGVTNDNTSVTGMVAGGVAGIEYTLSANIVTVAGQIATRSGILYVQAH